MGITERREREREEVRRKILDAAREQFADNGYDKVTMRGIAEAIEYSPTTIYQYFKDKDDLVNELCEHDFSRLLGVLSGQPPPGDPVEWIRVLGRAYARFGLDNPNHYRFMFMTPDKFEKMDPSPSGEASFGVLRQAVEAAVSAGRFRPGDPHRMAQVVWAGVHGAVALLITLRHAHWPEDHAPGPEFVDDVIENGIRGFLADAEKD
jgi:AcrR family transcriptional regulator